MNPSNGKKREETEFRKGSPFGIRTEGYRRWAPLFLRLVIGFGFMDHGWAKLSMLGLSVEGDKRSYLIDGELVQAVHC
jgi:hypothetical protein